MENKKLPERLCDCTNTTIGDVIFMCLVLGIRHNLTWEAQLDILKMVNSIYDKKKMPETKYKYFQYIEKEKETICYHIYCPTCEVFLGERNSLPEDVHCSYCANDIDVSKPSNFFLSISLESQLKKLLNNSRVASSLLTHRFHRKKEHIDAFEDIYDGELYKKHCSPEGILSSPFNFSFSFFTDGVPTGKSTGKSLWPIYVTINELPLKDRSSYILLAGLYIGSKDPNQMVFLQPFVKEVNKLSSEGFSWIYEGKEVVSKVIPLCAVTDSVARWQLLNMQSFHAFYGCTFCYEKQEKTGPRSRCFNVLSERADERTAESSYQDAKRAYERRDEPRIDKRHYKGVKGPSVFMNLHYFDLIGGFVVDYMHAILLGVVKSHMEYLFDSTKKKCWIDMTERISLKNLTDTIDSRLLSIQPPTGINRSPRSIEHCCKWKASEWRSWLLFYCIPCLQGLLKDKYLVHLAMLSQATNILLQHSVSRTDIEKAHNLFLLYCYYFQKYFKPKNTIYNLHLLTHICKCVTNWGPLWTHNAFCYEGQNRHLLQLYQSPFQVTTQIARKFLAFNSLLILREELVSTESTIDFSERVLNKRLKYFVRSDEALLLGKTQRNVSILPEEEQCFVNVGISSIMDLTFFHRLLYNGIRYTSCHYVDKKKNNDSYAILRNNKIVKIKYIALSPLGEILLLVQTVKCSRHLLVQNKYTALRHILKIKRLDKMICIKLSFIKQPCVVMNLPNNTYVCGLPFGCQRD